MLFSLSDIECLCCLHWCGLAALPVLRRRYTEEDIDALLRLNYLRHSEPAGAIAITEKGRQLLEALPLVIPPRCSRTSRPELIARRKHLAELTVLFLNAGFQALTLSLSQLTQSPAYYLTALSRGKDKQGNPWGNSRLAAVAAVCDCLYAVHYVAPDIGRVSLADELRALSSVAGLPQSRRAFIFAGAGLPQLWAELCREDAAAGSRSMFYAEAFRRLELPIHLLSCDSLGSLQLCIMAQPDYREKLIAAALGNERRPPQLPGSDASFRGRPFVLAVDLELRNLSAVRKAAAAQGQRLIIAALPEQKQQLLSKLYPQDIITTISPQTLALAFGRGVASLTPPDRTPYQTQEGAYLYVPPVQKPGKTGKPL